MDKGVKEKKIKEANALIIPTNILDTMCDNIEKYLTRINEATNPEEKIINLHDIYGLLSSIKKLNGNLPFSHERFNSVYAQVELTEENIINGSDNKE